MRQEDSSDDEEHFRKKEQRRTERDTAKLRPLILSERLFALLLQALSVTTSAIHEQCFSIVESLPG